MDIFLVRHGQTEPTTAADFCKEKNRPDPSLSAWGREQAERLARRLAGAGFRIGPLENTSVSHPFTVPYGQQLMPPMSLTSL